MNPRLTPSPAVQTNLAGLTAAVLGQEFAPDLQDTNLLTSALRGNHLFSVVPHDRPPRTGRLDVMTGETQAHRTQAGIAIEAIEAHRESNADLADLEPYRRWAAWRITIELARHMTRDGSTEPLLQEDEPLWTLLEQDTTWNPLADNEPWDAFDMPRIGLHRSLSPHTPRIGRPPGPKQPTIGATFEPYAPLNRVLRQIMLRAAGLDKTDQGWRVFWRQKEGSPTDIAAIVETRIGLPLRPPTVPRRFAEVDPLTLALRDVSPLYKPDHETDPLLHLWIQAIEEMASHLGIMHGTANEPRAGIRGLVALTNPLLVRVAWPLPREIIEYEEWAVHLVHTVFVKEGEARAREYCRSMLGLTEWEMRRVIALVLRQLSERANRPLDVSKGILIHRLEDLAGRAQLGSDLRAELGAMKAQAVVEGVARVEPEDEASVFRKVITAAGPPDRSRMPDLPPETTGPRKQLPS